MTYDDIPDTTNIINQPNCYYINNYSLIQNNYYILISILGGVGAFLIGLHIADCLSSLGIDHDKALYDST